MPHIIKIDQQNPDKDTVDIISKLISKGKTFVYPTETFYAIGALYDDETSINKIFDIKERLVKYREAMVKGVEDKNSKLNLKLKSK